MKISESANRYSAQTDEAQKSVAPASRITVRLKPELAERLDAARRARKLSVTAVIEQALESYLAEAAAPPKLTLLDALKKHGVLAAVDMGPDASVNIKAEISGYLDSKHDPR